MRTLVIVVNLDGAAFNQESGDLNVREVSNVIGKINYRILDGRESGTVLDSNGNACANFEIEPDSHRESSAGDSGA